MFESSPITNNLHLRIQLIRIRIHVIFSIDKTYVYCSDSFVLFAALGEALLSLVLRVSTYPSRPNW